MTAAPPPLIGTYTPPAVRRGSRVFCRLRRAWCRVTRWADAPLAWPRVIQVGMRSGSGLLVNRDMVRAIRTESAVALMHWFGVSDFTATAWRKAFGAAGQAGTEGTRRAVHGAAVVGGVAKAARGVTDAERAAKSAASRRLGLRPRRWTPENGGWTPDEDAILGTVTDREAAARTGRTRAAARQRRQRLGRPAVVQQPGGEYVVLPPPRPRHPAGREPGRRRADARPHPPCLRHVCAANGPSLDPLEPA